MRVLVRFEAELALIGDEVPALSYESVAQAVQNVLGHAGVFAVDVNEYEEQPR